MIKNINQFSKTAGFKVFIIFVLSLLFLIPLSFIEDVIYDRIKYKKEAIDSIVTPIGDITSIEGIIIAIPYLERISTDKGNNYIKKYIFYTPEEYSVYGNIDTTILNRGIFKVPVFSSILNIKGRFDKYKNDFEQKLGTNITVLYDEAMFIIGIGNKKSLLELPNIILDNSEKLEYYEKNENIKTSFFNNKLLFTIPKDKFLEGFSFDMSLNIQGGNAIHLIPIASKNSFSISSKWNNPNFTGDFLPTKRNINSDGFSANWDIAGFNTSFTKYFTSEDTISNINKVQVIFLLLNDNYNKALRSVKYSILFIIIPFFVLFLCEVMSRKKIHPVQYILVGFSNAIFYLLLISISEHIGFNISYLISALMVTILISLYVGYIIKSNKSFIVIALVQALIYIFLFGILQLTDYALLVGTLGLFAIIALSMYFSRNIDWYDF